MKGYKLENQNKNYPYWTDGKKVYFYDIEIKHADPDSFIIYSEDIKWAKDKNKVYCGYSILKKADKNTFEALNYSYVKDNLSVWTINGKVDHIDIETFEVCDDGKEYIELLNINHSKGYSKDKNNVYYYNSQDVMAYRPKTVSGALPETFVSMNDGHFGYDEKSVFYRNKKLKKANPKTWKLFMTGCRYSKDKCIYYEANIIKEADVETFEIINSTFAKDKNNYYNKFTILSKEEYEKSKLWKSKQWNTGIQRSTGLYAP